VNWSTANESSLAGTGGSVAGRRLVAQSGIAPVLWGFGPALMQRLWAFQWFLADSPDEEGVSYAKPSFVAERCFTRLVCRRYAFNMFSRADHTRIP
jgi:hypothetical protein